MDDPDDVVAGGVDDVTGDQLHSCRGQSSSDGFLYSEGSFYMQG